MTRKTIAILGVDGSGKSTAVKSLEEVYGEISSFTYMGYKDFEDGRIERLKGRRFSTPLIVLLIYRCFWKRYLTAVKSSKLAIFDRYVHEIFINSGGRLRWVNTALYRYLFPMPSKMVYLYCSVQESLKRKSDIADPEEFSKMKKRFDDFFLNRKNVLSLNTEELSIKEITNRISEFINNSFDL